MKSSSFIRVLMLGALMSSLTVFAAKAAVNSDIQVVTETGPTNAKITLGDAEQQKHIASCGIVGGAAFQGNVVLYYGLEPGTEYKNIQLYVKSFEGDSDVVTCSFETGAIDIVTSDSKQLSATVAILLAEVNLVNEETGCGFEWRPKDAPASQKSSKLFCPIVDGGLRGRVSGLNDQVHYNYRVFYQSAKGTRYFGDWNEIFTGAPAEPFDPILVTYAATEVTEHEATLSGYVLEAAQDFTEQGFEYWADSRVEPAQIGLRKRAQLGEKKTIAVSGITIQAALTDLDRGTIYKYCTYARVGNDTLRGPILSFTTEGEWILYIVQFLDKDGNVLSTQELEPGEDAVAPEAPQVEGYTFTGWDTEFTNVQSDLTVKPQYEKIPDTPGEGGEGEGGGDTPGEGGEGGGGDTPGEGGEGGGDTPGEGGEGGGDTPGEGGEGGGDNPDEAIDEVVNPSNTQTVKLLKQGNLYILRNGKVVNVLGQSVR